MVVTGSIVFLWTALAEGIAPVRELVFEDIEDSFSVDEGEAGDAKIGNPRDQTGVGEGYSFRKRQGKNNRQREKNKRRPGDQALPEVIQEHFLKP